MSGNLLEVDKTVWGLIRAERRRQMEKIILIPSESLCPAPVRQALASPFTSLYAEGHPSPRHLLEEWEELEDVDRQLAIIRRYSDRRYYRGCEFADLVEAIAEKRCAEIFATEAHPPETIFVNVQPLSGAAANNAVYEAFLRPGDTIMGLRLSMGGHLTHGSPNNRSGKYYNVVAYGVKTDSGRLDYNEIGEMIERVHPRMVIAGFSAYPWAVDWAELRRQTDRSPGCLLMADIAHPAGLVVAGLYPNPVGYAHVITFTTHKTLCGPRGAVIMTTDPEMARLIDQAVFPGEQGGPHMNNIAAKAVAFKLAKGPEFAELQKRTVDNARALAGALAEGGLTLAYGGTNTHMLLVDLRGLKTSSGEMVTGEVASRILDAAGIVCNKNTIYNDEDAAHPSGIRLGTTWVSQRGMDKAEMKAIADIICRVLFAVRPFHYVSYGKKEPRGKIDAAALNEARAMCARLVGRAEDGDIGEQKRSKTGSPCLLSLSGDPLRLRSFLAEAFAADIFLLKPGCAKTSVLLDPGGRVMDVVAVTMAKDDGKRAEALLAVSPESAPTTGRWLRALSDGYILFDEEDIYAKVHGPVVVRSEEDKEVPQVLMDAWANISGRIQSLLGKKAQELAVSAGRELISPEKPYFVGCRGLQQRRVRQGEEFSLSNIGEKGGPEKSFLYDRHLRSIPDNYMVEFAGWEMPVRFSSIKEEHEAVRKAAGLFDVTHMGIFEIKGGYAGRFLDVVCTNSIVNLARGKAAYTFLLNEKGNVLDDVIVYRTGDETYMMVANAANSQKVFHWLTHINDTGLLPVAGGFVRLEGRADIKDIHDGDCAIVDLALQGQASPGILGSLMEKAGDRGRFFAMRKNHVMRTKLAGADVIVARTGYTGEEAGYEIFVRRDDVEVVWDAILDAGKGSGIRPCGLGARDSLRAEAGLPLYGHELEGPEEISPVEAGLEAFIKLHKPFFVGRDAARAMLETMKRRVVRFEVVSEHARMLHQRDFVTDSAGRVVGRVTSSVMASGRQVGMAVVRKEFARPGAELLAFPGSGRPAGAEPTATVKKLPVHVDIKILKRFWRKGAD